MWFEELSNGKYKFVERYTDPYTEKEKRVSVTLTSKSKQAQKKALKILDDKINENLKKSNTKKMLFHDVYREWYAMHIKTLRPSSIQVYDSIVKILKDLIEDDVYINNIDTRYIQNKLNELDYSEQYNMHIKSIICSVFKYATEVGIIKHDPSINTKLVKRAKTFEDIEIIENKFLELEEAERLIKELYRRPSSYRLGRIAEFLFLTGARIGEAVILKPSDFDFDNNVVHITGTIDKTKGYKIGKKGPTKNLKGNRSILLTERSAELVKRTIQENKLDSIERENYLNKDFIFTTKSGTPVQTNSFNLALKGAGKRIDLEHKDLSSHIFRHTHVSILAENNVPLKAIMERIGHEDAKITNKIYTHVTSKMKNDIIFLLNKNGL